MKDNSRRYAVVVEEGTNKCPNICRRGPTHRQKEQCLFPLDEAVSFKLEMASNFPDAIYFLAKIELIDYKIEEVSNK